MWTWKNSKPSGQRRARESGKSHQLSPASKAFSACLVCLRDNRPERSVGYDQASPVDGHLALAHNRGGPVYYVTRMRHLTAEEQQRADFQLRIAREWIKRGEKARDPFAAFFFFYTSFNALFFLWGEIDNRGNRETSRICHLVSKVGDKLWSQFVDELSDNVRFFAEHPIQRMDGRPNNDPTGERKQAVLNAKDKSASQKAEALALIIYRVRCNLAHGSKRTMGDDRRIVKNAVPVLRRISLETLEHSNARFGA